MKFEIFEDMSGEHYFLLRGDNGETIAQSEPYGSREDIEEVIEQIKDEAPYADIEVIEMAS